mmetsp:Transcript_59809/g.142412  ORF Transcript_59809/g.142412 Transcript_59809/m.142412 type:complete len:114 (+) Transcript_59809:1216-1557(+)
MELACYHKELILLMNMIGFPWCILEAQKLYRASTPISVSMPLPLMSADGARMICFATTTSPNNYSSILVLQRFCKASNFDSRTFDTVDAVSVRCHLFGACTANNVMCRDCYQS